MREYFRNDDNYNSDDIGAMHDMLNRSDLSDGSKLSILSSEFVRLYNKYLNLQEKIIKNTVKNEYVMVAITEQELKEKGIDTLIKQYETMIKQQGNNNEKA